MRRGDAAGAAAEYERAVGLWPAHADAWLNLGAAYRRLERVQDAAACARRVLELRPDDPRALNNLGNVLNAQGRLDEAARCYRRALQVQPGDAEAHYNLVNLSPLNDGSPESEASFELLSRTAEASDRFTPGEQSALQFALGRALDARGRTDEAFTCLARANALHRSTVRFDELACERLAGAIISRFDERLLARLEGGGSPSEQPVFVVGMPRSGTTLVEQILSAHPEVHGAGEVGLLPMLVSRIRGPQGQGFPAWTASLQGEGVERLAQAYLKGLERRGGGASRITDKTIGNFELLGLVHLMLPKARIIHCRRDPRDVCVSCFSTRFSDGHPYAYELGELGRYWRRYERLMDHWRALLPPGRMLEIEYEALVADPEPQARRLIEHLGLEWSDDCLRFYESPREVWTASSAQVRRPVHQQSVGRWRRFAGHLGPLLDALGPPWSGKPSPG